MSVCPVCGGVLEGAGCGRPCRPQPSVRPRRSIAPRARVGLREEPGRCRVDERRWRRSREGSEAYVRRVLRAAGAAS